MSLSGIPDYMLKLSFSQLRISFNQRQDCHRRSQCHVQSQDFIYLTCPTRKCALQHCSPKNMELCMGFFVCLGTKSSTPVT